MHLPPGAQEALEPEDLRLTGLPHTFSFVVFSDYQEAPLRALPPLALIQSSDIRPRSNETHDPGGGTGNGKSFPISSIQLPHATSVLDAANIVQPSRVSML